MNKCIIICKYLSFIIDIMKAHSDLKNILIISRNLLNSLLDISNKDLTNSEVKLLAKCKSNSLELLKDILTILSKLEARNLVLKSKINIEK